MAIDVCKACSGRATELYPIGKRNYLGINISEIICNILHVNIEPTFGNSLICPSCITTLHLINEKIENLRRVFAPPAAKQTHIDHGCSTPSKSTAKNKNSSRTVQEIDVRKKTSVAKKSTNGEVKINAKSKEKKENKVVPPTGVESSLSYADIDEEHSSTRLPEESEKKEKQIPKRRNTIYHFDCEFCDFETGMVKAMQQHLIDSHDVKAPRLFECKQCSTKYVCKQGLDTHNKRHHPENGVETEKNATSQDDKIKTNNKTLPVKKSVSAKTPAKPTTPDVRSSPQKLKTPSDIKKELNFTSSDDIVSPQKPSTVSKPVSKKVYKCDQCPMECDSTFRLELHKSLNHCFIPNQSDDDDDDDNNETTLGISNGLDGSNLNEQEVPETDSDFNNEQQVIPSPKKSPKASISQEGGNFNLNADKVQESRKSDIRFYLKVPGISSVSPVKQKSDFNTKCDFCTIIFNSPINYANHLNKQHGIEEPRVFKCTQCDKTYKTQGVLRRHIKNVHEKINNIGVNVASDHENDNNETKEDSNVEVSCYEAKETLQKNDDNASNSYMEFPFQIAKIKALPVRTSLDQDRADEPVKKTHDKQNTTYSKSDQELDSIFTLKKNLKVEHNDSNETYYVCDLCPAKYKHKKNVKRHKEKHHSSNVNEDLAPASDHLILSVENNGSNKEKRHSSYTNEDLASNTDHLIVSKQDNGSRKEKQHSSNTNEDISPDTDYLIISDEDNGSHKVKRHFSNVNVDLAPNTDHLIISDEDNDSEHIKKQKKTKVATPAKNNSFQTDDAETGTISSKKRKAEGSNSKSNLAKSPKKAKLSVTFQEDQLAELDSNPQPDESITCSECNKSFKSKEKLERHYKKHHTAKQLEFVCRVGSCRKQYKEQLNLDMHIKKKHHGAAF